MATTVEEAERAATGADPGGSPEGRGSAPEPSVWTWASNPWWEAMAEPAPEDAGSPRPRGAWRRLLDWLIEYNRY
jgi:hypothetical protein